MRVSLSLVVLTGLAGGSLVYAQGPGRPAPAAPARGGAVPSSGLPRSQTSTVDPQVQKVGTGDSSTFRTRETLPEPASFEEMGRPSIALPTEPIEPYLLTRENGPFMVMAHTFRGPDAVRYAQALAMELRSQHNLPAYVYYLRFQPGRSNIRNVPPTAPDVVQDGEKVQGEARYRSYDEAAVLVGDCRTVDDSEDVLKRVKKVRSKVLDGLPSIWAWRKGKGLSRAILTTNPLVASQELYPGPDRVVVGHVHGGDGMVAGPAGAGVDPSVLMAGFKPVHKPDPLIKQMNSGPHSVSKCAGPYVLEVASFLGRSTTDPLNANFQKESFLKQSPLAAAADKAESLAAGIDKCKTLDKGVKAYVYHDRSSSRVYLGPFQSPDDPRLKALMARGGNGVPRIHELSTELMVRGFTQLPLAPGSQLNTVPEF